MKNNNNYKTGRKEFKYNQKAREEETLISSLAVSPLGIPLFHSLFLPVLAENRYIFYV